MLINIRLFKSVRDSSHCRAHVLSNSIDLRFEIKYAMILFFMQKKKTIQQPFYSLCAFIVQWLILDLVTVRLTYCICLYVWYIPIHMLLYVKKKISITNCGVFCVCACVSWADSTQRTIEMRIINRFFFQSHICATLNIHSIESIK